MKAKSSSNKDNIRELVWKIINSDVSLKKDLARGLINIRGLASYIIKTQKMDVSTDAVVSAIRRYKVSPENKEEDRSAYEMLKQARVSTRTKMASVLLKRTDDVKTILGRPEKLIDYQGHEIIRVIEGKEALTLIFDQRNLDKIKNMFPKRTILKTHKKIGMIEASYPITLEKTPGVFNIISSGLAEKNISIIDAIMSSMEHIIVVKEDNLLNAFEIVYNLCK